MSSCHTFRPVPGQFGPRGRGPLPAPPFDPQDYWATKKFVSSLFESIETKIDKYDVVDPSAEAEAGKAADAKSTYEELNRILGVASDAQKLAESKADQSELEAHVKNTLNPHGVTAEQIFAYTKSEVDTKLDEKADQSALEAHVKNTNNPHSVTAEQVGAYTKSEVETKLDEKADRSVTVSHFYDTTNPHHVTAFQIGAYTTEQVDTKVNDKLDKQLGDRSISWDDSLGYLRIKNAILDLYSDSPVGGFGIQIGGNTLFGDVWQLTSTLRAFQKIQLLPEAQLTFLDDNWNEESIEDRIKRLSSLAPEYSTSSAYSVGQYVFHDGSIYRCTTAIALPGEAWNPAHWSKAQKLDNFFTDSNSLLTGLIAIKTSGKADQLDLDALAAKVDTANAALEEVA